MSRAGGSGLSRVVVRDPCLVRRLGAGAAGGVVDVLAEVVDGAAEEPLATGCGVAAAGESGQVLDGLDLAEDRFDGGSAVLAVVLALRGGGRCCPRAEAASLAGSIGSRDE